MNSLEPPRVLICGSRRWPWPDTVAAVLNSLADRYGRQLVIIEGAATGADRAAHRWCEQQRLPARRHRCHPASGALPGDRRPRAARWSAAERCHRVLLSEEPRLVVAFHEDFDSTGTGGASDTCLRALLLGIPVWLTPTEAPRAGQWLQSGHFPENRVVQLRAQLAEARRDPAATRLQT